jgi:hypothetical protein
MSIKIKHSKNFKTKRMLKDIDIGSCFVFYNKLYMRMEARPDDFHSDVRAVCLHDGKGGHFSGRQKAREVDADITIF